MTPEQAIGQLDRQMSRHGQSIAFRRATTERAAVGFVRGYKPEQLVGMITQKDRQVTVSPSSLGSFVPQANDDFTTAGMLGKVMAAEPIHVGSTIVRWNLQVRLN